METPAEVLIHNDQIGLKGAKGRLLTISPQGFYEVNLPFGEKIHRILLPVQATVVIAAQPEEVLPGGIEIER